MKHETAANSALSPEEIRFWDQLRQQPELQARFQSILELTCAADGPVQTADEAEALVVEELRQLGQTTLTQWAVAAEARVASEIRNQDPSVRSRKKKH
jgi:hypothetical protein